MNVKELTERPQRCWNEDGLLEMMVGLIMLVPAIVLRVGSMLGSYFIIAPLALIGFYPAAVWAMRRAKERVTFPRGGYIALPERSRPALGLLAGAAVFLTFYLVGHWAVRTWSGLALAAVFIIAYLAGGRRGWLLAIVPAGIGVWIYWSAASFRQSVFWLMVIQGGAMAISGAVRLRRFVKANPKIGNSAA